MGEWIWNLAEQHFPRAVQIVDLYHARQHLWDLARRLYPHDERTQKAWMKVHQKRWLDKGKIEKLMASLRSIASTNAEVLEKIRIEANYFETKRPAHALSQVPPRALIRRPSLYLPTRASIHSKDQARSIDSSSTHRDVGSPPQCR